MILANEDTNKEGDRKKIYIKKNRKKSFISFAPLARSGFRMEAKMMRSAYGEEKKIDLATRRAQQLAALQHRLRT